MKINRWIWGIFLSIFLCNCYDDEGNYDYNDVNTVNILGVEWNGSDYWYTDGPFIGDPIILTPQLSFALDSMATNFTYKWEINGRVVGTERVLRWIADTVGYLNECMLFTISDTITHIKYLYNEINVSIDERDVYDKGNGWVVLSSVNNVSRISLIIDERVLEEGNYVYRPDVVMDIYAYKNNGESLGGKPIGVTHFWTTGWRDPGHQMLILQEGGIGPVYIDGKTMEKSIFMSEEFFDGRLPNDVRFVKAYDKENTSLLLTEDGKLFIRPKVNPEALFTGRYDQPFAMDKGMEITHVVTGRFDTPCYLVFDKKNNRFLIVYDVTNGRQDADFLERGIVREVVQDEDIATTRLDGMGNVDMKYVGAFEFWGEMYYMLIYKDNNASSDNQGMYCVQKIRLNQEGSSTALVFKPYVEWEIPFPRQDFITEKSVFQVIKGDQQLLLFSGGSNNSVLYGYMFEGEQGGTVAPKPVFDFEGVAIKQICTHNFGNETIVSLEDGSVYWFQISESIMADGGIKKNGNWHKLEQNFGNIQSLEYFTIGSSDW